MTAYTLSSYILAGFFLFLLGCTSSNDQTNGKIPSIDTITEQTYTEVNLTDTLQTSIFQPRNTVDVSIVQKKIEIPSHQPINEQVIPDSGTILTSSTSKNLPPVVITNVKVPKTPSTSEVHSIWDDLLKTYVDNKGRVDYSGMLEHKKKLLDYFLQLSEAYPTPQTPRNEAMAYWINAYNAFTVALILDHWPVTGIKDLDGGNPWDVQRIKLDDKAFSLNEIEHGILRKNFADPRIHFALVCAAKSCPPLMNRAWKAASLEKDLEQQTKAFIRNGTFNTFKKEGIQISPLFDWYAGDFENVLEFISTYLDAPLPKNTKISFMTYDWRINSQ